MRHAIHWQRKHPPCGKITAHIAMFVPTHISKIAGHIKQPRKARLAANGQWLQKLFQRIRHTNKPAASASNFLTDRHQKIGPLGFVQLINGNNTIPNACAADNHPTHRRNINQRPNDFCRHRHGALPRYRHTVKRRVGLDKITA